MRQWKKTQVPPERVFLYFHEHPRKLFTIEHVTSQTKIKRVLVREIVEHLLDRGKLEGIETVSSRKWGRPRVMYRAIHVGPDSFKQLEIFTKFLKDQKHVRIIK